MATITVQGRQIDVNIREELEEYEWESATWTDQKLIASSPFREDQAPSFYIDLAGEFAGVWGDSALVGEYNGSGTLPKLLAHLRRETYEEACEYLLAKYDVDYSTDEIELKVGVLVDEDRTSIPTLSETLDNIELDTEYLPTRGIHPKVIEMMSVYNKGNAIGIPWYSMDGRLSAIKYRRKDAKEFWYAKGSVPISELVYGLDIVVQRGITRAVICEAEVDSMTWMSAGIFAIAIGGARMNAKQADMVLSSGIEGAILGGDNDAPGRKFNDIVAKHLKDKVELFDLDYAEFGGKKDANDLGASKLSRLSTTRRSSLSNIRIQ